MKNFFVCFVAFFAISIMSCEPEEEMLTGPPCETEAWGHIRLRNTQAEPLILHMDGEVIGTVNCCGASRVFERQFDEGIHSSSIEYCGKTYDKYVHVAKCSENQITF